MLWDFQNKQGSWHKSAPLEGQNTLGLFSRFFMVTATGLEKNTKSNYNDRVF